MMYHDSHEGGEGLGAHMVWFGSSLAALVPDQEDTIIDIINNPDISDEGKLSKLKAIEDEAFRPTYDKNQIPEKEYIDPPEIMRRKQYARIAGSIGSLAIAALSLKYIGLEGIRSYGRGFGEFVRAISSPR